MDQSGDPRLRRDEVLEGGLLLGGLELGECRHRPKDDVGWHVDFHHVAVSLSGYNAIPIFVQTGASYRYDDRPDRKKSVDSTSRRENALLTRVVGRGAARVCAV